MRRRSARAINRWASLAVVVALALLANYFGGKYWVSGDWTKTRFHSLSGRTLEVVEALEEPLRIVSLLSPATAQVEESVIEELRASLRAFEAAKPGLVTLEERDPLRDPAFAQSLLEDPARGLDQALNVVLVEMGGRSRQISLDDMIQFDQAPALHGPAPVKALTIEGEMLQAIVALSRERSPVVRFATGHGEVSPSDPPGPESYSLFVEALESQDIRVEPWSALGREGSRVPDETDLVVVAAPALAWGPQEARALADYLDEGGRLLVFVEPLPDASRAGMAPTGLEALLASQGVTLVEALALDPAAPLLNFGAEVFYSLVRPGHPIGDAVAEQPLIFNLARPLIVDEAPDGEASAWVLVESSREAWGETDLPSLERGATRDGADEAPPLTLAAALASSAGGRDTRLVVIGDASIATDETFPAYAHRPFLIGAVGWLLEDEPELGLAPKDRNLTQLFLDAREQLQLALLVLVFIPGGAVAVGVFTWWRRRSE